MNKLSQETQNRTSKRKTQLSFTQPVYLLILGLVLLGLFMTDIALGSVRIPFKEVWIILTGGESSKPVWDKIVFNIRIPKACTAILAGVGLSLSGLQMQTLFRNPLAGPSVLGISAGASLGVALVMLGSGLATATYTTQSLGIGGAWLLVLASTAGSSFIFLIILGVSLRIQDNVVLLIVGIMVGNITIALVSVWQFFSSPEQIQDYLVWTFGSLGGVTRSQLAILALAVILGVLMSLYSARYLNLLLLGENYARSMGLGLRTVKAFIICSTSIMAGAITGFCGPIGFLGIAVPHLGRSLFNTSDHRLLIPVVALMGATLMLLCDIIAQLPGSTQTLPINAVTALLGSPVVIWVILQKRNLRAAF